MIYNGYNGYKEQANQIFKSVAKIKETIDEMEELEVLGDPKICVVSFISIDPNLNIYAVHQVLTKKGWNLTALQMPAAIHFGITAANVKKTDEFIKDLKKSVEEILTNPTNYKGGSAAAIYGTTKMIPDIKTVEEVSKVVIDCALKL